MGTKKKKKVAKKAARKVPRAVTPKKSKRARAAEKRRREEAKAARIAEKKRLAKNEAARQRYAEKKQGEAKAARDAAKKRKKKPAKKPVKKPAKWRPPAEPARSGDGWEEVSEESLLSKMERFPKVTQAYIDAFHYAKEDVGRNLDSKIRKHLAATELDEFDRVAKQLAERTGKELAEIYQLFFSP